MKRLRVGDLVQVIKGKDSGKQGKILKIDYVNERAVVEGLKILTKHKKPLSADQKGEIVKVEGPIHLSNIMPVDPESGKPTRVKVKTDESGKKTRICKSGTAITG